MKAITELVSSEKATTISYILPLKNKMRVMSTVGSDDLNPIKDAKNVFWLDLMDRLV